MKKFFRDFKAFISRGNVMDLAVGMIIGTAFTAIVTALSEGILKPLINYVLALIFGEGAMTESFTFFIRRHGGDRSCKLHLHRLGRRDQCRHQLPLDRSRALCHPQGDDGGEGRSLSQVLRLHEGRIQGDEKERQDARRDRSRREGARRGKSRSRQGRRGGSREAYHGSAARRHQEYSRRSGEKGLSFFVPFGKNIAESYARMNMRAFFLCR